MKQVSNILIALAMLLAVTAGGIYLLLSAAFSSQFSKVRAAKALKA